MEENWYNLSVEETEKKLNTNSKEGLTTDQVNEKRSEYGYNELNKEKKKSLFVKFLEQFKDFMIIILIIAAIVSGVVGYMQGEGFTDSIIIFIVIIVNAIVGVAQESKAEKSLEALQKLSSYVAKVVRNGNIEVVPSKDLVPGDIVILETGDFVPADLRIVECINLKSQESSLTGESVPVEKMANKIDDKKVGIGDRSNMLFSSSLITYGRGKGIVVKTGMNTEVGKIAGIISSTVESETPLQGKLNKLGKTLGISAIAICVVIFIIGLLYHKDPLDMFMTAVSLAVAAIPEGLAAVSTIVLAIGVQRMVKRHAIVKKLPAVETLGSSSVICSDKTGTLTQNRMTVKEIFYDGKLEKIEDIKDISSDLRELVYVSMLCNDTKVGVDNKLTGDPTETALIDMGFNLDFQPPVLNMMPRIKEIPFDSSRKLMTTVNQRDGKYYVFTKGGVDELLKICNKYLMNEKIEDNLEAYIPDIKKQNEQMADKALRVLAMGYKILDHEPTDDEMKKIENDLIYIGMVGMIDPPREEVKLAVQKCKSAGIKTVMITGDHKSTAVAIAKELGIMSEGDEAITGSQLEEMTDEDLIKNVRKYAVYARVSPEHKVRIVKAWQANGEIVAMTGDGVNDAPALKTADIGCAMGIVGTDVSKEAADVILTDDNFATIVSSVEEGRRIYDNILKAIQFLLSSNVGEIIVLFIAILIAPLLSSKFGIDLNLITPLLPIHILWINLVTDSLPALALAVDPAEKDVMNRKPNKKQKGIFTKGMSWRIIYQGVMIGILTLAAFIIGIATPNEKIPALVEMNGKTYCIEEVQDIDNLLESGKAKMLSKEQVKVHIGQAMAFIVLAFSELVHVFNIRNNKKSIFKTGIGGNKWLFGAILLAAILVLVIVFVPAFRHIFEIPTFSTSNIIEIVSLTFAPIIIVELFKLFKLNTIKEQ